MAKPKTDSADQKAVKKVIPKALAFDPSDVNAEAYALWLQSHAPVILQELFNATAECSANERAVIYADLLKTISSQKIYKKPTVVQSTPESDSAKALAALLNKDD